MELAWLEKTRRRRRRQVDNRTNFSSRSKSIASVSREEREGDTKLLHEANEEVERLNKLLESSQEANSALKSQVTLAYPLHARCCSLSAVKRSQARVHV